MFSHLQQIRICHRVFSTSMKRVSGQRRITVPVLPSEEVIERLGNSMVACDHVIEISWHKSCEIKIKLRGLHKIHRKQQERS